MKKLVLICFALVSAQAFASHPHDRICVGTAEIDGQSPVSMVFQWEIERLYDHGGPNEDTHRLSFEARSCYGDYLSDSCDQGKGEVLLAPTDHSQQVPVTLKNAKGEVFFQGSFSWANTEILVGKINRGPSKPDSVKEIMADAKVSLSCVSQPRMSLDPAKD